MDDPSRYDVLVQQWNELVRRPSIMRGEDVGPLLLEQVRSHMTTHVLDQKIIAARLLTESLTILDTMSQQVVYVRSGDKRLRPNYENAKSYYEAAKHTAAMSALYKRACES